MSQHVFNKNTYECNPWYPQLDIIRPHHPELIFGIPPELAVQLKERAFAEKWLRTANIVNGNYFPAGVVSTPTDADTPPDLGEDEDNDIPPEFSGLDPVEPPPLTVKRPRTPKRTKKAAPETEVDPLDGGDAET